MAVLHALFVTSLVSASILPALHSLSVLEVILPVSLVSCSIDVNVDSITVGLVVLPLTFVDVAIRMPKLAFSICLIISPFAFVFGIVGPNLDSWTVSHVMHEVASINSSVFESQLFDELQSL